ncbi:MAG: group II intron reverse transcriptase/maturase, partial [Calditrichia bacterium]|nr:group II intron reverse transcriptase/maturase [Calditrichia bacterium]
ERVQDLQRKLYRKAKQDKGFRFYVLYDKVRLPHFLREAYRRCKAKNGCPGVDGVSFKDVEAYGVDKFISEIIEELENKTYKPQAVLRVEIPKANGKTRSLGIPTVKDRVVQMTVKLVIEPIFEADFEENSYGFRPRRSAGDAVREIKKNLQEGKSDVFDADLSAYFDTIPHKELMHVVALRISDKNILHLIKMWLKAPVMEDGRPKGGKKSKVGTPQGGVISPLLANIYLHLLDKAVNRTRGIFQRNGVKMVRYADDLVLMAEKIPEECFEYMNRLFSKMKLKLNEEKSRVVCAYEESFDFLGHTFRFSDDLYGRPYKYWNVEPSKKSQKKVRSNIREYLSKNGHKAPQILVDDLNAILRGWINYFTIQGVTYPNKAKRNLRYYLGKKLQRYYKRKSQRKCKLYNQGALRVLVNKYGLVDPTKYALR